MIGARDLPPPSQRTFEEGAVQQYRKCPFIVGLRGNNGHLCTDGGSSMRLPLNIVLCGGQLTNSVPD